MSEWKEVGEAPLGSTTALVWSPECGIHVGTVHRYNDGVSRIVVPGFHGNFGFCRWMQMPSPPTLAARNPSPSGE